MELMLSMDEKDAKSLILSMGYAAGMLTAAAQESSFMVTARGAMSRRLLTHAYSLVSGDADTELLANAIQAGELGAEFEAPLWGPGGCDGDESDV